MIREKKKKEKRIPFFLIFQLLLRKQNSGHSELVQLYKKIKPTKIKATKATEL